MTLQDLRKGIGKTDREVLDQCWGEYKKSGQPVAVRDIYHVQTRPKAEETAKRLSGSLVREISSNAAGGYAYQITYVGAVVSSDGPRLQKLLEKFVSALRDSYEANYARRVISSNDLNIYARLSKDDLFDLGRLLYLGLRLLDTYVGGQSEDGSWQLAIGDKVEDVRRISNVTEFVERELMKGFDPNEPTSDVERANRALREQQTAFGRTHREKQQKFGILDAPNLLPCDLKEKSGLLGRAVIYLDIDDFKTLNTELTETVVDEFVLPPLHSLLNACVNRVGFAYAEGGDEFTALLPNASREVGIAFGETIRAAIESLRFSEAVAQVRVTASVGIAHDHPGQLDSELVKHANEAKRFAKRGGKNCVAIWRQNKCDIVTGR